jgi:phenylalanyl-tRNA synthetase alpha chain
MIFVCSFHSCRSKDSRFLSQFKEGSITKFKPFSKYPLCYKDVSFWLPSAEEGAAIAYHPNEVFDIVRGVAGDLVEKVYLLDEFKHPKTGKVSNAFRIDYRSMERSLENEEINVLQARVRDELVKKLNVKLR